MAAKATRKSKKKKSGSSFQPNIKLIAGIIALVVVVVVIVVLAIVFKNEGGGDVTETTTTSNFTEPTAAGKIVENYSFIISDTSVFVRRNGTVLAANVEDFSADYYDVSEFTAEWLEPEVKKYNYSTCGVEEAYAKNTTTALGAAINSLTLSGSSLVLQMDFATTADYLAFNKQVDVYFANWKTFTVVTIADHDIEGLTLLDSEGNEVSYSSIKEADSTLHMAIVDFGGPVPTGFTGKFVFEGAVKYVSSGISITDENAVRLYESDGLQYIIFE